MTTKVAVYGSLRQRMHNHGLLDCPGAEYLGTTQTDQEYAMYSLGGFPMVQLEGEKVSPIVVEIYDVDDEVLRRLNQLEGYRGKGVDNFYDCSTINTTELGEALIYHIEGRKSERLVSSGDWVEYYRSNRNY